MSLVLRSILSFCWSPAVVGDVAEPLSAEELPVALAQSHYWRLSLLRMFPAAAAEASESPVFDLLDPFVDYILRLLILIDTLQVLFSSFAASASSAHILSPCEDKVLSFSLAEH